MCQSCLMPPYWRAGSCTTGAFQVLACKRTAKHDHIMCCFQACGCHPEELLVTGFVAVLNQGPSVPSCSRC